MISSELVPIPNEEQLSFIFWVNQVVFSVTTILATATLWYYKCSHCGMCMSLALIHSNTPSSIVYHNTAT